MQLFVVDTSVLIKFFSIEDNSNITREILKKAISKEILLLAPSLLVYELNSCLIKKGLKESEINESLDLLYLLIDNKVINVVPHSRSLLKRAYEIASKDTKGLGYISIYDSTFHALAIIESAIFLTADQKHYQKSKDLIGSVRLLENWKAFS